MTISDDAQKALEIAIAGLDRQYGENTVIQYGHAPMEQWPSISTGAINLDLALGIGGLPRGRIIEIFGPESSGKTTIALTVIAQAQKLGLDCVFVDVEHALDPLYAQNLGVNMGDLWVSQPNYGEQALEIVERLINTGAVSVIVVDSVAALVPKAELDGEMEDQQMGLQARLMAKALRKITGVAKKNDTMVIFINQLREKIGIMFGNPETTPGGKALRYHASMRIDLRKREDLKSKTGQVLGVKLRAKCIKNKLAAPYKFADFKIVYGKGIDTMGCLVEAAIDTDVMTKSGPSWIKYNGEPFEQGVDNAARKLASDLDLAEEIQKKVLEAHGAISDNLD